MIKITPDAADKEAKEQIKRIICEKLEKAPASHFIDIADGLKRIARLLEKTSMQGTGDARMRTIGETGALLKDTMSKYMSLIGAEVGAAQPAIRDDGSIGQTMVVDMSFPAPKKSGLS